MAKDRTAHFLAQMEKAQAPVEAEPPPAPAAPRTIEARESVPQAQEATKPKKAKATSRAELKHFGGYLDDEALEKIALLRVRLKLDNSALIKLAIDDLYRKHTAKRAFGDA